MVFINRLQRLFKADMHALLDQLEDPYLLLKQAIRDMQQLIANQRLSLAQLNNEKVIWFNRIQHTKIQLKKNHHEIVLCFKNKNEQLIKPLLCKKIIREKQLLYIENKIQHLNDDIKYLEKTISKQCRRLTEIKEKKALLSSHADEHDKSPESQQQLKYFHFGDITISKNELDICYLQERQAFKECKYHV